MNFLQLACKLSPLPVGQRSARDSQTTGRHVVRGAGAEGDEAEGVVAEEVRQRDVDHAEPDDALQHAVVLLALEDLGRPVVARSSTFALSAVAVTRIPSPTVLARFKASSRSCNLLL